MDEDSVHISDTDEAKASISNLLKAIEGWATKESQKGELELTAFSAALASGIISFHDFTSRDCRNSKNLIGAVSRAKLHIEKEYKKFDSEIDKMHIKCTPNGSGKSHQTSNPSCYCGGGRGVWGGVRSANQLKATP